METDNNYKLAVMGYEPSSQPDNLDCPMFTNVVRTEFGSRLVEKRMKKQGLLVIIDKIENMKGMNPYYELEL